MSNKRHIPGVPLFEIRLAYLSISVYIIFITKYLHIPGMNFELILPQMIFF